MKRLRKIIKIRGGIGNFHCIGYGLMDIKGNIVESVSTIATPRKIRTRGKSITVLVPNKFTPHA